MTQQSSPFNHPVFEEYGQPIVIATFPGNEREFLVQAENQINELLTATCRHENQSIPDFAFTWSDRPQAFARIHGVHRVIGITIAQAILIRKYFLAAMTYPHNLYTEYLGQFDGPPLIENPRDIRSYTDHHVPSEKPLLSIAEGFARYALLYIAAHELGHLTIGHTASLLQGGVATWDEEVEAAGATTSFDKIAMEVAADRYAADALANYIAITANQDVSAKFLTQTASVALNSMFYLQRTRQPWARTVLNGTHPPMQFRAILGVTRLCQNLLNRSVISQQDVDNIFGASMEVTLKAHEQLTGIPRSPTDADEYATFLPTMGQTIDELLGRHRELFPNCHL